MAEETSLGGRAPTFRSTVWEVVRQAQTGAPAAMEQLLADCWKPVYFFIRRRGYDIEQAKDLTQGFLGYFLEKDLLSQVAADRGRFRSFVIATLNHFLLNERARANTAKRGGKMNFTAAEVDLPSADLSPDQAFFKGWALTVLERAMERLRSRVSAEDMDLLAGKVPEGLSVFARKNRLTKIRGLLRRFVREEALPGIEAEGEIDSEIRAILRCLA